MNLFTVTELLVGITTFLNGVFIIITGDVRKKMHRMIIILSFATSLWGFGNAMVGFSDTPKMAMFWWKIAHLGGFFTVVFILHLVLLVTDTKRPWFLRFAYIQAGIAELFLVFNFFDVKMAYSFAPYYRIVPRGAVYPLTLLLWLVVGIYACSTIYDHFRRASGQARTRYKYLWIALMCGFCGGATHLVTVFFTNFFPFGNFLIWLFPVMTTYAVLRHQLLDIEVVIRKTFVFAGLLASTFAILILPTLLIQEYILRSAGFSGRMIGLALSGLIIILTMRRIENFLINVTDKYLFQKKYDYKELLKTFTSEVLTVLNLGRLLDLTVDKLTDIIKPNSCAVLLFDNEKQQFDVMAFQNIKDPSVTLVKPDGIVEFFDHTHGFLLRKELTDKKIFIPDDIQLIMDKLSSELIIPMVLHEKVIGILSLGKKKSDEEYTQDDLDIILPLARTLAIAISNAELFDELGKTQAEAAQKEKMAVIGTLSAGINHEICNPLGIARGQCEAFLLNIKDGLYKSKTADELLHKAQEIMAKVIKETDRATAITKKLSSFAKPAKGESELVDISKEVDEVLGLVGYELKLEKIEIEKSIDSNLPHILVDRKQFQEVLFNLLRNAGQAIGDKGKISIMAKDINGKVTIDIQDTGTGIADDKIKELFNPFFTTKDPGKGTGLGLFIVRQVVEKNGGRIHLKNTKVGEGTTFSLEFPAATLQRVGI